MLKLAINYIDPGETSELTRLNTIELTKQKNIFSQQFEMEIFD